MSCRPPTNTASPPPGQKLQIPLRTCLQVLKRIPENDVITAYADGMAAAVREYNSFHDLSNPQSIILFVVQPNDKNSHDQQVHRLCSLASFGAHAAVLGGQ